MLQYLIRRILWAFVMLTAVIAMVFVIFFVLPGGSGKSSDGCDSPVAVQMAGRNPRPELVCNVAHRLGLDRPVYVQFFKYIGRLFHGDLGYSYHSLEPVSGLILHRLPATISMAIGASIVWLGLGSAIGIVSALKRGTIFDRSTMIFALIGLSTPIFFLGLVSVFFFDSKLHIYEAASYVPVTEDPIGWLQSMWLPWLVLAFTDVAVYARMVRGNVLDVANEDYIRTARAKGLRSASVTKHAVRCALIPIITLYGLDLGELLGGAVITETIFNIPGIGALAVHAITQSDLPVILGTTIVASAFVIFANVIVDVTYARLDPRVVYS